MGLGACEHHRPLRRIALNKKRGKRDDSLKLMKTLPACPVLTMASTQTHPIADRKLTETSDLMIPQGYCLDKGLQSNAYYIRGLVGVPAILATNSSCPKRWMFRDGGRLICSFL